MRDLLRHTESLDESGELYYSRAAEEYPSHLLSKLGEVEEIDLDRLTQVKKAGTVKKNVVNKPI